MPKRVAGTGIQRMFPKYGGTPLPWPPIVLPPFDNIEWVAKEYVAVLDAELNAAEDGGRPKWSGIQRQVIRRLREKWFSRSMGQDAHYKKHGTFIRPMESERPTMMDKIVEETRRRQMEQGTWESNASHKRKRQVSRSAWMQQWAKDQRKKHGTKNPEEQED